MKPERSHTIHWRRSSQRGKWRRTRHICPGMHFYGRSPAESISLQIDPDLHEGDQVQPNDLRELHFITHVTNVPSMLEFGVLSHQRAETYPHISIANPSVQEIRKQRRLPTGRMLHEYANLYLNARNAMMYVKVKNEDPGALCVLRIAPSVITLPGVLIADGNAAHNMTRFDPPLTGLEKISEDRLFAQYWENKRECCAEVLVPDFIGPGYIIGGYVSCETTREEMALTLPQLPIIVSERMFFIRW